MIAIGAKNRILSFVFFCMDLLEGDDEFGKKSFVGNDGGGEMIEMIKPCDNGIRHLQSGFCTFYELLIHSVTFFIRFNYFVFIKNCITLTKLH